MEENKHEILLGLTTTPKSDWRGKVAEIKKFKLTKIALFPTFLKIEERKELYELLEGVGELEIPHVHLRDDMEQWELEMFRERYGTKLFNIHEQHLSGYTVAGREELLKMIHIENQFHPLNQERLDKCGGLCIDFSHWESAKRKKPSVAKTVEEFAKKYTIGCCHVSAIKTSKFHPHVWFHGYDCHYLYNLNEVDYLQNYKEHLPYYMSLELENDFEKQLEVKKYIEDTILNTTQ